MKVVYLTTSTEDASFGVKSKIKTQISVMQSHYIDVELIDIKQSGKWRSILSCIPFVNFNYDFKKFETTAQTVDCVYMRYFLCDIHLISSLIRIKHNNPKVKILIEIPTYPYDSEYKPYSPLLIKDKLTRFLLKKYVTNILTYSLDSQIYGIPAINISNGINTSIIRPKRTTNNNEQINIICVACISFWHGIDRIIYGLLKYYLSNGNRYFVIHIVGNGDMQIISQYKNLVNEYQLQKYVKFYGEKKGKELDDIYDICDLAFDSLGRHRSRVFYNSSLKGKEYLAKGLPIISGVKTELDNDKNFKYYLRIPADDTPVDFKKIADFFDYIYEGNNRTEIIHIIRTYCVKKYDIAVVLNPVLDAIMNKVIDCNTVV